tara:strand:- start:2840 stop:3196 length:357 start_codon:yes stop_codon:yes gene_type:complete
MKVDGSPIPHSVRLANALDAKFRVPGTRFRFGLDPVIGLLPVAGDTISLCLGLLILADARRLGARKRVLALMLLNLGVDWVIGMIPLIGDVADFFIKPNRANANLLLQEHAAGRLRGG